MSGFGLSLYDGIWLVLALTSELWREFDVETTRLSNELFPGPWFGIAGIFDTVLVTHSDNRIVFGQGVKNELG